jgi:hypothetical protein
MLRSLRRVLEVQLPDRVTRRGVAALIQLKSLEEFIFPRQSDVVGPEILGLLYELLPNLHVAAFKPAVPFVFKTNVFRRCRLSMSALEEISSPRTLQLHHLVRRSLHGIPEHVSLPQVRELFLLFDGLHLNPVPADRFPNLTALFVRIPRHQHLMCIVGHGLGRKLHTLRVTLSHKSEALQVDELLDACPNLSELSMESFFMQSAEELRPDTLGRLRILRVQVDCSNRSGGNLQPGLVLQLLRSAPELRALELDSDMLDLTDMELLAELVERDGGLRHLERLSFSGRIPRDSKDQIDQLVISCSTHCKQLREVVTKYSSYMF